MLASLLGLVSPAGLRARLSVLIFHRVKAAPDELFVEDIVASKFDSLCGWLVDWFNVLPLDQAARRLSEGTLPPRALCITFDDGYADNREVALPILLRHGLTATFFITTGFLDGGRMWNDSVIEALRGTRLERLDLRDLLGDDFAPLALQGASPRRVAIDAVIERIKYLAPAERQTMVDEIARRLGTELPRNLMMSSQQVREMRQAGMQIGAHTLTHPILARLDAAAARAEIGGSKRFLEALLDEPVTLFAYPNGKPGRDFNDESVAIARELGFETAVTTAWGVAGRTTDRLRLPRFTPWERTRLRFGARMFNTLRTQSV